MHMADALLSPAVGVSMCAVSAGAVVYAAAKIKKEELDEKKIPVMGVMGAFVFAAQMINFTIPATGSSGHIGGGILLAAVLGGGPAFLTITAVLIIQCLLFADGGLLALGCNVFNMGLIPCLLVYPLLFKPLMGRSFGVRRLTAPSILGVVLGLQLGAFAVVVETLASGITALPFATFLAFMQPIHLAIGLVEGIVTAAVLHFVFAVRPELLESAAAGTKIPAVPMKKVLLILGVLTLVTAGGLSLYASGYPDGLEWSVEAVTGSSELEARGVIHSAAAFLQKTTALLPDYDFPQEVGRSAVPGTSAAGLVGGALTFGVAISCGLVISAMKKKAKNKAA